MRVASQLSEAVTVAAAGMAVHSTVTSAGTPTRVGGCVSCTVMVWVAVVVLPQLSVTVQVLTMVPHPSVTELDVSLIVDRESGVAVVGSGYGGGGRDGRTLDGYIGGHTHQGWRLCILDGNGLGSGGCVAAVVGDGPGSDDGSAAFGDGIGCLVDS